VKFRLGEKQKNFFYFSGRGSSFGSDASLLFFPGKIKAVHRQGYFFMLSQSENISEKHKKHVLGREAPLYSSHLQ
jgi:hypothetical protein